MNARMHNWKVACLNSWMSGVGTKVIMDRWMNE